jgi:hypothetical protein
MKRSEKVLNGIYVLVAFPLAIIYSIGWGRHQEASLNLVVNWVIIVVQNGVIYSLCLWEKKQSEAAASRDFDKWRRRINSSRWTTNIFSGNFFFFLVGSIWFRLATYFLGLENKPGKYLPGLLLAMIGKGYTEMWLGAIVGWVWGQIVICL